MATRPPELPAQIAEALRRRFPAAVQALGAAPVFSTGLPLPVIAALQRGDKIGAVRLMREIAGVGLKEAKEAVEASPHAATHGHLSPGEVPRTGFRLWVAVMVGLVAIALYLATR